MRTIFVAIALLLVPSAGTAQSVEPVPAAREVVGRALTPADVEPDLRLQYEVSLGHIVGTWTGLEGQANVTVHSRSVGEASERLVQLQCGAVYLNGLPLGALNVTVWEPPFDGAPAAFAMTLEGSFSRFSARGTALMRFDVAKGSWTGDPESLAVVADGQISALQPIARWLDLPIGGAPIEFSITRELTPHPTLQAKLSAPDVTWNDEHIGELSAALSQQKGRSEFAIDWTDDLPVFMARASLPLSLGADGLAWKVDEPAQVKLSAHVSPKIVKPWHHVPRDVHFDLFADAELSGSLTDYDVNGAVTGNLALPGAEGPLAVSVKGSGAEQMWSVGWGEHLKGKLKTHLAGIAALTDSPLKGDMTLRLPLTAFTPFAQWLGKPKGMIHADLVADGTIGVPQIDGDVALKRAAFTFVPFNRRLTKIVAAGRFDDDVMKFEASANAAPGTARLSGSVAVLPASGTLESDATLELKKFPFVSEDFPVALIDAELTARDTRRPGHSESLIDVERAFVRLLPEHLPKADSIPVNDDIHIAASGEDESKRRKASSRLRINFKEVARVLGEGTDIGVSGGIDVRREGDIVRVDGGFIPTAKSKFTLLGNEFLIRDGLFSIRPGHLRRPLLTTEGGMIEPAPLMPTINLVAEHQAEGTWVLVRLIGSYHRPELTLRSLPALPEYQIMTLLITGRVDSVDDRSGNVRRTVARMVERYHNPSLERQLFDRIGIDKVGLGFRSSVTNPVLTVGKQLTRTLYLETVYRHGAPPDLNMMEGHVEKRFGRRWTLDTVFGDAAEGRFGGFWRRSFGGPPPPEPTEEQLRVKPDESLTMDDEGDGIRNVFDLCQRAAEDADGYDDHDGCPEADNDQDGVIDGEDAAPNEAESFNGFEDTDGKPDVAPTGVKKLTGEFRPFFFAKNKSRLDRKQRGRLRALVAIAQTLPDLVLVIEGHADADGETKTIERVSRRRAQAVERELRRLGILRDQLEVQVIGATKPRVEGDSEEANQANRRVEVRIVRSELSVVD